MSSAATPYFVVVDSRCRIKYVTAGYPEELERLVASALDSLPDVDSFLREADAIGARAPIYSISLSDERVLRVVRIFGEDETMFVLSVEEDVNRKSLSRAVRRHQLTRRETAVLTLILDGLKAGEIARLLNISENTVQGYFKRLLAKTGSRNRASMVAKILDWEAREKSLTPEVGLAV